MSTRIPVRYVSEESRIPEERPKSVYTFSLTGSKSTIEKVKNELIQRGIPIAHVDSNSIFVKLEDATPEQLDIVKQVERETLKPFREFMSSLPRLFGPSSLPVLPSFHPRPSIPRGELEEYLQTIESGGTIPNEIVKALLEKELRSGP